MISPTFLRKLTTKVVEPTTFDVGVEPASFMSVVNAAFFSDPMLDFMPKSLLHVFSSGALVASVASNQAHFRAQIWHRQARKLREIRKLSGQ